MNVLALFNYTKILSLSRIIIRVQWLIETKGHQMIVYMRVGVYQLNIYYFMHPYHPITGTRNDASTAQVSLIPEKCPKGPIRSCRSYIQIYMRTNTIKDQTQKDYVTEKIYSKHTNELNCLLFSGQSSQNYLKRKQQIADAYLCAERIEGNGIILNSEEHESNEKLNHNLYSFPT